MAGIRVTDGGENSLMISEKAPALWSAPVAATNAWMRGARPDEVFPARVKPIGRKTRSNASRLATRPALDTDPHKFRARALAGVAVESCERGRRGQSGG